MDGKSFEKNFDHIEKIQDIEKELDVNEGKSQKRALIIGNTYKNSNNLEKLVSCEIDANNMEKILKSKNYVVRKELNLETNKMQDIIINFSDTIEEGDTALFYFSGHGISFDGFNYLLPENYESDERTIHNRAIGYPWILQQIVTKNPKFKIFLLDCCRERIYERVGSKGASKPTFAEIGATDKGSNIVIACSCSEANVAKVDIKDDNKMSFWTQHLIEELENNNNDKDEFTKVLRKVRTKIRKLEIGMIPWDSNSLEDEDFYL